MFERYTEKARRVIFFARYEASQLGSPYIETEHLLLGLLREDKALTNRFLRSNATVESIRKQIEGHTTIREKVSTSVDLPLSNDCKRVLAYAAEEAERLSHKHIGTEHLLLGLLREEKCFAAEILHERGLRLSNIREELARVGNEQSTSHRIKESLLLPELSRDLSQEAREGQFHRLVGRENEVERVIQILCRRTKNNAVLIGELGVGKTEIVKGLAQRMADGSVPSFLEDKKLLALNLSLLDAESSSPAQFRDRLKAVIKELSEAQNVIVFVDELLELMTPASSDGWLDAASIVKPALLQGSVQCIATTTSAGYSEIIDKDNSFASCFQKVRVLPPSESECIRILVAHKEQYEKFHNVTFADDAIAAAVVLARRYIPESSLPGNAVDLLDEAGARVKLCKASLPEEITEVQKRVKFIVHRMETAIANHEFEKARFYSDEERKERENLSALREKYKIDDAVSGSVSRTDMEELVGLWTGSPVTLVENELDTQQVSEAIREVQASRGTQTQKTPEAVAVVLAAEEATRPAAPAVSKDVLAQQDYAALDELLARVESELITSRAMPIRRLRRKQELGGQVIGWSYSDRKGGDLDLKAAELLLNARLASIGLGLSGGATWTSDDDGSTLAFWRIGHPQLSETPPRYKQDIQRLESLDTDRQRAEAKQLAKDKKFSLLVAWLCEAKYPGIPGHELKQCGDEAVAEAVIRLLQSSHSDIRERTAGVLGPLGGEGATRALCSILPRASDHEILEIAYALFRLPSSEAIPPLTEALHKATDFYQRVYLAKALAHSGGQGGFNVLIAELKKGDRGEDEYAQALLALDDPRATQALKDYLGRLQMRGAAESYQKPVREFLIRHGESMTQLAASAPAEVLTSLGFTAREAAWSVDPGVVKLREAIKNTWNVNCRILELSGERAESVRRQAPMGTKQWVEDGQYQIELGPNSIFVHAYGSWVDVGYVMFLYHAKLYYVNVAPAVDLTRFIYDRTDDLSHMAKIAITLANHIGSNRKTLLVCLEGELAQTTTK